MSLFARAVFVLLVAATFAAFFVAQRLKSAPQVAIDVGRRHVREQRRKPWSVVRREHRRKRGGNPAIARVGVLRGRGAKACQYEAIHLERAGVRVFGRRKLARILHAARIVARRRLTDINGDARPQAYDQQA